MIGEALHPECSVAKAAVSQEVRSLRKAQRCAELNGCSTCRWWWAGRTTGVALRPECNERLSESDRVVNPTESRAECIESCGTPMSMVSI